MCFQTRKLIGPAFYLACITTLQKYGRQLRKYARNVSFMEYSNFLRFPEEKGGFLELKHGKEVP